MERLKKRSEFVRVAKGVSAARPGVVVQARTNPNPSQTWRLGFTASKKVGKAVDRNHAKRRLREAARHVLPHCARPGVDYVFIARAQTRHRSWSALLDDVKEALITVHSKPL